MKTEELFESQELLGFIRKAIEQAEQHPDVINWDQEPQHLDADSYEEALHMRALDALEQIEDPRLEMVWDGSFINNMLEKLVRRRAIRHKRQGL